MWELARVFIAKCIPTCISTPKTNQLNPAQQVNHTKLSCMAETRKLSSAGVCGRNKNTRDKRSI